MVASAGRSYLAVQASRLNDPWGVRGARAAIVKRVKYSTPTSGLKRGDVCESSSWRCAPSRKSEARRPEKKIRLIHQMFKMTQAAESLAFHAAGVNFGYDPNAKIARSLRIETDK